MSNLQPGSATAALVRHRATAAATDAAFRRIVAHLAEEVEIRAALRAIAAEIGELIPFTHADICLLDRPGWVVSHEIGIHTRWSRRRTRVNASPVRDVLLKRCPMMLTANAMHDPRHVFPGASCGPILDHHLRARINVPLRVMGEVTGTLNISHEIEGYYDTADVELASHLANILAPSFHALHTAEHARQVARMRTRAQERTESLRAGALELTQALERERQRIGMDLHDQTLADLTRLLRELTHEPPLDRGRLARNLSETIADLRSLIDTAVPTLLDLFGFSHAIRVYLERAVEGDGITVDVLDKTGGKVDRLQPTARTALFRIAQEAINNAAKHAHARLIRVIVTAETGGELRVVIQDNGCGLPSQVGRRSGLSHLRTRADLIGAELEVVSNDGTCVTVTLPAALS